MLHVRLTMPFTKIDLLQKSLVEPHHDDGLHVECVSKRISKRSEPTSQPPPRRPPQLLKIALQIASVHVRGNKFLSQLGGELYPNGCGIGSCLRMRNAQTTLAMALRTSQPNFAESRGQAQHAENANKVRRFVFETWSWIARKQRANQCVGMVWPTSSWLRLARTLHASFPLESADPLPVSSTLPNECPGMPGLC